MADEAPVEATVEDETDLLDFSDLEPKQFRFKFKGQEYIARQTDAEQTAIYRGFVDRAFKGTNQAGNGLPDCEVFLLNLCVYKKTPTGEEVPTGSKVMKKWPNQVVSQVFEKVLQISGLGADLPTLLEQRKRLDERIAELEKATPQGN